MKEFLAFLQHPIVVALLTAFAMWMAGWVRTFLAKRVRVQGPEAEALKKQGETLEKLVPAVNCLLEMKGPEIDLLIAVAEAAQGHNNGNVTAALERAYPAREGFKVFQTKAACIEVPNG
jgi:hypothetical protein